MIRPLSLIPWFALSFGALAIVAPAQTPARTPAPLKVPRESPAATVALDVGVSTITVQYHRPALKGRDVWKDLGATDVVWRLGANDATTLTFTHPVTIAGKEVPAGTYALFARVGKEKWTFILNKVARQWGAYFYDEKSDLLRFEATPSSGPKSEWFTLHLDPVADTRVHLTVAWDTLVIGFDIDVDVDAIFEQEITKAIQERKPDDWEPLFVAAQYWCKKGERLDDALDWIEQAIDVKENAWTCEWKGRVLHALGDDEPALPLIEKALEHSKGEGFPEGYREGLRQLLKEWRGK